MLSLIWQLCLPPPPQACHEFSASFMVFWPIRAVDVNIKGAKIGVVMTSPNFGESQPLLVRRAGIARPVLLGSVQSGFRALHNSNEPRFGPLNEPSADPSKHKDK